jgi:hypothetical protein
VQPEARRSAVVARVRNVVRSFGGKTPFQLNRQLTPPKVRRRWKGFSA